MCPVYQYPPARYEDVSDDYFGTKVSDPYRWLENDHDEDVVAWMSNQQALTQSVLSGLPMRSTYRERATQALNYSKYTSAMSINGRLFFTKSEGLQAQPILYVQDGDEVPRVVLDPNQMSEDGTVSLSSWHPSSDGRLLVYAISESGSDWVSFKILDVDRGVDLEEQINNLKFTNPAWLPDNSGFYYSKFNTITESSGEENRNVTQRLLLHRLGTVQAEDELVYEHPDLVGINMGPQISHDGSYVILTISGESFAFNRLYYRPIDAEGAFIPLCDEQDASYTYVGNDDHIFYILTTKDSPHQRIVAIDLQNPAPDMWRDVVAESTDIIRGATMANNQFVLTINQNGHSIIKIYGLSGNFVRELDLPGMGYTGRSFPFDNIESHRNNTEIDFIFASYLQPTGVYRYKFASDELVAVHSATVTGIDLHEFETTIASTTSADGTQIRMFIVARKDIVLDGTNPTILSGYGGFGVSLPPYYDGVAPVWLVEGGVVVYAVLRGGGEYGEEWHLAGQFEKKQNVFDDFIAVAEYLIGQNYTSPQHLAIEGLSNGGLLVAATMLQRPELFGSVLCRVPVTDMLRFQNFTAGRYWISEYGDATSSKEHFDFLYAYSPLHNVKSDTTYPPILILTADHDDRVVPMHSLKFAATLQAARNGQNTALLRVETNAGHGAGKSTDQLIEEMADTFAFARAASDGLFQTD